jgi:SAM-dependent methyltransferase
MPDTIDTERAKAFAKKMLGIYTGDVLTTFIDIGYETGLLEVAAKGPGTSEELARRAGLDERYVREWLAGMTTGGVFTYDPASRTYTLPVEHALYLTGGGARNLAPMSRGLNQIGKLLPRLLECFRHGGGIPYAEFRPDFTALMDDMWRRIYDEHLLTGFLPAAPGLPERLQAGIRVADVGCGTGHAINLMAKVYPNSDFFGYDIAKDAIEWATEEARALGLTNARFEVLDVAQLPAETTFDLITTFDSIHDQADPAGVLRCVSAALAPGGTYLMIEPRFSSHLEGNLGNPFATLYYGFSVTHCMTVSLAEAGAGLGTVWGEQTARRMLAEVGFTRVEVVDSPRPPTGIYVCRK